MKTEFEIDKVILRRVKIPFREPFRIANGSVSEKESIIVEIYSEGAVGYGEASPMSGSFYSSETPSSTWDALANDLVPDILSRTIQSAVGYAQLLNDYTKEPFARAGIEGAVWYLTAKEINTTIADLLGAPHGQIPSGLAIGIYDSIPELIDQINSLRGSYARTKIKIQPGWDIDPLRAIRDRFPDMRLMVDANGSYNYEEHSATLHSLEEFGLMMIEQPFAKDALEDMARLAAEMSTPICADESAENLDALEAIINSKAADIINIKVQRIGGLWNARRMHDRCEPAGLPCWLGTMPELGIASAQSLSLATLPMFQYPTDVEASDRWFVDDIITPKITVNSNGDIQHPTTGPSPRGGEKNSLSPMGYDVDIVTLEKYTVAIQEFKR